MKYVEYKNFEFVLCAHIWISNDNEITSWTIELWENSRQITTINGLLFNLSEVSALYWGARQRPHSTKSPRQDTHDKNPKT